MFSKLRTRYHQGRYKKILDKIGKRKKVLLDVGCGRPCECMEDGSFLKYIGFGIGLDIKKTDSGFPTSVGSLTDLPFSDGSFDVVCALEVLEHIGDVGRGLGEISRVLESGGVLVVSTPNNNFLWRIVWPVWTRLVGRMWEDAHMNSMGRGDWMMVLSDYFRVVDCWDHWMVNTSFVLEKRAD